MRRLVVPALAAIVWIGPLSRAAGQQQQLSQNQPTQQSAKPSEPVITRVYDVRELVAPTHEFPVTTSSYARAFIAPAGQSINSAQMNTGTTAGTNQLFQNANLQGIADGSAETKALTSELIKMVQDTIATDSWKDNGGSTGVLRELKGMLVVTQTAANHDKVADLLSNLLREQGGMVRVKADWVLLSSADAAKLTKSAAGSDEALAPVDPTFLQNLSPSTKHFTSQTLSRNGQTVYVISGMDRTMVTSAIPVVSTGVAAYATDVSNVGGGIALEVNSRVNFDTKFAVVTVYSTFTDPAKITSDNVTVSGATTQPGGSQLTLLSPTVGIQPFGRVVQDLRTTVRLPLGASIVAGSMTLNPQTEGGDEQQLVLILKVTASK